MDRRISSEQEPRFSLDDFSPGDKIIIFSGCIVLLAFFLLPWATLISFISLASTGHGLASGGRSAASGLPLTLIFVTPIAALACLLLSLRSALSRESINKDLPTAQIIIAVLGLLPFILLPFEFKSWSGGKVVTGAGLWLALLTMLGVLWGAVMNAREGFSD